MKKFLLLATSILFFSCAEQFEYQPVDEAQNKANVSQIRSVDQAIEIANEFLSVGSVGSRSNSEIKVSNVILSDITRSAGADTLIYALDIEDNNGFVLVAAPKNVEPILAVIDEGSFNDPQNLENKSYQMILNETKDYVARMIIDIPKVPDPDTTKLSLDLRIPEIVNEYTTKIIREPLVEVEWNQRWPENIFCENEIAGCTPIAIAQLLSYFELPKSISYTFPGKDINSENLNWSLIKQHKNIFDCFCSGSNHLTLARLIREIGQRAKTDYTKPNISLTGALVEPSVIKTLSGLSPDAEGKTTTTLFSLLSENIGIAILGGDGHSFIADAIKHLKYKTIEYLYNPDGSLDSSQILAEYNIQLIHYNWGWFGNCNGFFKYDILDPNRAEEYDNPKLSNTSDYSYSCNKQYYYFYKAQH